MAHLLHLLFTLLFLLAHPLPTTASDPPSPPMGPRRRPIPPTNAPDNRVFTPDANLKANLARAPADRTPAFVRMPVQRRTVNGTGKWEHGMHWDGTPGERGKRNGRGRGAGAPGNMSRDGGERRFGRGSIEGEGERPRVPGWVRRGGPGGSRQKGEGDKGSEWGDDLVPTTNTGMLTATRTESSLERRQTNTYGYKWGWAHLWDIGGIAYSIPCKSFVLA